MGTPLGTRVRLKLKRIARELTETPEERAWRLIWPKFDAIEGWLYLEEGKWLCDAARCTPCNANIVEIGSFKGRSTCCIAIGCVGTTKRVFAIDSFDGGSDLPRHDSFAEFSDNILRVGVSKYIEPIKGLSTEVAKNWMRPIHLLFIDGSHHYEEVVADFNGFFPHVISGGVVAFHDVDETKPGVLRAWNEIFKNHLEGIGFCQRLAYGRKAAQP
jgi:predicted O-methyltransferase YrrM